MNKAEKQKVQDIIREIVKLRPEDEAEIAKARELHEQVELILCDSELRHSSSQRELTRYDSERWQQDLRSSTAMVESAMTRFPRKRFTFRSRSKVVAKVGQLVQDADKVTEVTDDDTEKFMTVVSGQEDAVIVLSDPKPNVTIRRCRGCTVIITKPLYNVTIGGEGGHGCSNCTVIVGKVNGSLRINNSSKITAAAAVQQLRPFVTQDLTLYLRLKSHPISERHTGFMKMLPLEGVDTVRGLVEGGARETLDEVLKTWAFEEDIAWITPEESQHGSVINDFTNVVVK